MPIRLPVLLIVVSLGLTSCSCSRSGGSGEQSASDEPAAPAPDQAKLADCRQAMQPVLERAKQVVAGIEKNVRDYSAVLQKRERIGGKLGDRNVMSVKIRNQPLSVYMSFSEPAKRKGDEAIYVEGQNDGKLLGHTTGLLGKVMGTVPLDPNGSIAMEGGHYPITQIGILNLSRRLTEFAEKDLERGECEVKVLHDAKVDDRPCTCIEVVHPVKRPYFLYHLARVFIDDQYNVPVRYEAYDWPAQPGGAPELIEEFIYVNLKLNQGFTDEDFDPRNPKYSYP